MGIFSMILSLLSGVALFLFGMSLMGDGLKMVVGVSGAVYQSEVRRRIQMFSGRYPMVIRICWL